MNFDSSISTDISLSRILDTFIMDGSDLDVILAFLGQHEDDLKDIFAHSTMAYELFDVSVHPNRVDVPFLVDHIEDLPRDLRFYTVTCFATSYMASSQFDRLKNFSARFKSDLELKELCRQCRIGKPIDLDFLGEGSDGRDFVELVDSFNDARDIHSFVKYSTLALSAFQIWNFLRFKPATQYMLVAKLKELCLQSLDATPYPFMMASLLRQLLATNNIEMFNWVLNVIGSPSMREDAFGLSLILRRHLLEHFPHSIQLALNSMTFPEVVFEWNMQGLQYESIDLFLYTYISATGKRQILEFSDILELLDLPFDWCDLEAFKGRKD